MLEFIKLLDRISIGRSQEDQFRNGWSDPTFLCFMFTFILQMLYCCMLHFNYVFTANAIRFSLSLSGSKITILISITVTSARITQFYADKRICLFVLIFSA